MGYVSFRCARAEVFDNRTLRLRADQVREITGCDYLIGGWVFNNDSKSTEYLQPYNWVKVDGQIVSQDVYHEWRFTCDYDLPPQMSVATSAPYVLSGVPILKNGDRLLRDMTPDVARPAARQAVCWTRDGKVLLWCSKKTMSRDELQNALLSLNVWDALMMDGGGSVQGRGEGLRVDSSRILSNFLCFWKSNEEMKEENPVKKFKVCLDAGHDASNKYNKAPDSSYYEHEFALDMAKRIKRILAQAGVDVVESRPDGNAVSLGERCRISNAARADLFVSLHSNATAGPEWADPRGLEVYVYGKGGKAEKAAQAIVGHMDDVGVVLRKYPVVAKPDLYVLRHTTAPAVLIEHGFHTNKEDVALLRQNSYRQMLAIADAQGILDYLGVDYKAPGLPEAEKPELPKEPTEMELAVEWALAQGVVQGNAQGNLMLDQVPTRGQVLLMLYRMFE